MEPFRRPLVEITVKTIDVHVLPAGGPAPGGADVYGHVAVGEHDFGIVVHLRIYGGLILPEDGEDLVRNLSVQQPGSQVGPVAAEVDDRAAAVQDRVREPVQELLAAADLRRALVAVIDVDADEFPELPLLYLLFHIGVARVPGGLIIGEQQNAELAGQESHLIGILQGGAQGLFHHHVDATRSAGLHHRQMFLDGPVGHDRLGTGFIQHLPQVGEEQRIRDLPGEDIVMQVACIGFPDTHHLYVAAPQRGDDTAQVVMRHARHADAERLRLQSRDTQKESKGKDHSFHTGYS